jgi:hypothetical protein
MKLSGKKDPVAYFSEELPWEFNFPRGTDGAILKLQPVHVDKFPDLRSGESLRFITEGAQPVSVRPLCLAK